MTPTMMHTAGPALFLMPLLHAVGFFTALIGVLFLLMWAFKHLPPAQLKKWGWILLLSGGVICFLTTISLFHSGPMMGKRGYWHNDRQGMMRLEEGQVEGGAMMMRLSSSDGASSAASQN